jgi:ribonucleoside-diphosphate reductase beta chain
MQNFNTINEWSLKDEQEHVRNNMKVLSELRKDLTEAENIELDRFILLTIQGFKQAEKNFFDLVFEMGNQEGMTKDSAKEFIDYLCELRLFQLGLISLAEVRDNPLDWIDYILTGTTHSNFFETKVVDYSHNGLEGSVDYAKYLQSLNDRNN